MFRFLLALLPFLLSPLQTNPPAGDGKEGAEGAAKEGDGKEKPKVEFTPEQQTRVNDIEAAVRKSTEERVRNELKAKADEDRRKADADAQRKKDEDAGQFEAVKSSLTTERDTAVSERDTLKTRVETLEKLANDRLAAIMADIPKAIADLAPDAETPIERRLEWAERAAKAAPKETSRGNGPNPKPAGNTTPDHQTEVRNARQRPAYRPI